MIIIVGCALISRYLYGVLNHEMLQWAFGTCFVTVAHLLYIPAGSIIPLHRLPSASRGPPEQTLEVVDFRQKGFLTSGRPRHHLHYPFLEDNAGSGIPKAPKLVEA